MWVGPFARKGAMKRIGLVVLGMLLAVAPLAAQQPIPVFTPSVSPTAAYITITGTGTITGADVHSAIGKGLYLVVDVTSLTGTAPTITPAIQLKDQVSGKYVQLHAAFTAIGAAGTFTYLIYPGVGAAAGGITATSSAVIAPQFRVVLTYGGTVTASAGTVAYHLIQ